MLRTTLSCVYCTYSKQRATRVSKGGFAVESATLASDRFPDPPRQSVPERLHVSRRGRSHKLRTSALPLLFVLPPLSTPEPERSFYRCAIPYSNLHCRKLARRLSNFLPASTPSPPESDHPSCQGASVPPRAGPCGPECETPHSVCARTSRPCTAW